MSRILCFALVVVASTSCARPEVAPLTDADRAAVADSVTAGMRAYEDAIKAKDVQRVLGLYGDSAQFRLIDNETVVSYAALRSMLPQLFGSLRSYGGGFGSIHVNVLSRDVALADAPYVDILTDTAGAVTRIRGAVTWVWLRGPRGWRIIHGQAYGTPDTTARR
jgi:ketosteroid isomerase-like protein